LFQIDEKPKEPRGIDLVLLSATLLLVSLGLVMVYSSSAVYAASKYGSGGFFLTRTLAFSALGFIALYVGWRVDYRVYQRLIYPMLGVTFLVLIAILIPGVGKRVDGAVRWFRIFGFSIQPSEPAKFVLVAYLAYSLAKKRESVRSFSVGFLPHLCVAGLMAALVLKQPDLGTAAVLAAVSLAMLFISGTKLSYLVLSLLVALPIGYQLIVGTSWRMRRLLAFLDPWAYRKDAGYQISESLISVGSGGFSGLGLGEGKQKLFFLPAAHTDFIFAITGEELGFLGICCVVLAFGILIARGMRASLGAADLFGSYLAFGITSVIGLQAIFHMSVVLGMVPTKGITLPFVSSGGSALISALFCIGVLLNIAARRPAWVSPRKKRETGSNRRRASKVVVSQ
jgi:cell division protein FtsW